MIVFGVYTFLYEDRCPFFVVAKSPEQAFAIAALQAKTTDLWFYDACPDCGGTGFPEPACPTCNRPARESAAWQKRGYA